MDSSIYEKLNKISDLEERALLKKILLGVFSSLEEYTKKEYEQIQERVFNEVKVDNERYDIYTTICNRDKIDPISEFLFPMIKEDLEKPKYEINSVRKALMYNEDFQILKVFLECDYLELKRFLKIGQIKGEVITNKKSHECIFEVKKNKEYNEIVERLYENTINNNIYWKTKNLPYINKIVDVILIGCKDEFLEDEEIEKIEVDFGEFSSYVKYNMVPLWNIEAKYLNTNGFPIPCKDRINYEYSISIEDNQEKEEGYIVKTTEDERALVDFTEDSIKIITSESSKNKWEVYRFTKYDSEEANKYEYLVLGNNINNSFSYRYSYNNTFHIKTKGELAKIINSYSVSELFNFVDMSLQDVFSENEKETYNLNYFIEDEIREEGIKKALVLNFKAKKEDYFLNRDIMSFIVSEIQIIYPEYDCEGRLI